MGSATGSAASAFERVPSRGLAVFRRSRRERAGIWGRLQPLHNDCRLDAGRQSQRDGLHRQVVALEAPPAAWHRWRRAETSADGVLRKYARHLHPEEGEPCRSCFVWKRAAGTKAAIRRIHCSVGSVFFMCFLVWNIVFFRGMMRCMCPFGRTSRSGSRLQPVTFLACSVAGNDILRYPNCSISVLDKNEMNVGLQVSCNLTSVSLLTRATLYHVEGSRKNTGCLGIGRTALPGIASRFSRISRQLYDAWLAALLRGRIGGESTKNGVASATPFDHMRTYSLRLRAATAAESAARPVPKSTTVTGSGNLHRAGRARRRAADVVAQVVVGYLLTCGRTPGYRTDVGVLAFRGSAVGRAGHVLTHGKRGLGGRSRRRRGRRSRRLRSAQRCRCW